MTKPGNQTGRLREPAISQQLLAEPAAAFGKTPELRSSGGDLRKVCVACFCSLIFQSVCVYRTTVMALRAGGCCCPLLPPLP